MEPDPGSAGVGKANICSIIINLSCHASGVVFFLGGRADRFSVPQIMNISLNGEKKTVPDNITVMGLLEFLNIQHQRVAVELNMQIVKKDKYSVTSVREGDSLEVVSFMGGG